MKVIYLLGCFAVLISWWETAKRTAKEDGDVGFTVGNALNLVVLIICSWLGLAKVLLHSYKPELYNKVIYTFKGGNNETDLHSDPD